MSSQFPLRVCIDRYLPGQEPSNQPPDDSGAKGALDVERMWELGRTLRVRFLGGDPAVHTRVIKHALEWTQYANLKFDFGDHANSEIRVAFVPGGSWSYIGKNALGVRSPEPTLNLGWLTPETPDSEYARVVLHEFGHAIGLIHEHLSPAAQIKWNKPAVYQYYAGPPNFWSQAKTDHNLFNVYSADRAFTQFTAFDPQSIMVYPVPPEHTLDGFTVGWNMALSATDKAFVQEWYPSS